MQQQQYLIYQQYCYWNTPGREAATRILNRANMKHHVCNAAFFSTARKSNYGSLGVLGFSNPQFERRYVAHRQLVMSHIIGVWTLFGTTAVMSTLAKHEFAQLAMYVSLLLQAARFLALRHFTGVDSNMVGALRIISFPLRAASLVVFSAYFSIAGEAISQLLPLFAVYDAVLFPCIEQVRQQHATGMGGRARVGHGQIG